MTRNRRDFLSLMGGSAVALLAACSSSKPSAARPPGDARIGEPVASDVTSVVMVGDSITAGSDAELRFAFAAAGIDDVIIDAHTGRRIEVGRDDDPPTPGIIATRSLIAAGADPDLWIVALGTNDVGSLSGPPEAAQLIDSLLGLLPPEAPVAWIDVYRPDSLEQTDMFNLVLRDRLASRRNGTVLSWFARVTEADADLLKADRVHPNADGRRAFAEVATTAIAP
jgi:hypothetical protein